MFAQDLARRAAEGNPIRVGIIGTGKFGAGLVAQIAQMKGIVVSAIADINPIHARHAYTSSWVDERDIRSVETLSELEQAVAAGKPAVTEDGVLLTHCDQLDVIVEATGIPDVGARMAFETLTHGKHLVMVNVETDVTVGAYLRRLADSAGLVYTLVDGDQPGATMNIVEWARTLGFEIVAAGRGTTFFADDRAGTPDTVPQRFGFSDEVLERRTINLKMFNSFRDGSKAQIEMTALANMAGLPPDKRGMHEPSANLADIPRLFSCKDEGGLLSRHGVVELANSVAEDGKTMLPDPIKMGVFAVVRTEHPFTQEDLRDYFVHDGGNGHNFLLYRPYHLVAVTAPMSILHAVFLGRATGSPLPTPVADVITVAKRDLKAGERLDGSGGYTVYGLCERADVANHDGLLPLGLAAGVVLNQDVRRDTPIAYSMVTPDADSLALKMRRLQDALIWG